MKRFYYTILLLCAAFAITSCEPVNNNYRTTYQPPVENLGHAGSFEYRFDDVHSGTYTYDVHHFMYKGHAYIMFDGTSGETGRLAAVHDPNCKCHRHQQDQLNALIAKSDSISARLTKIERGLGNQNSANSKLREEVVGLKRSLYNLTTELRTKSDSIR